jgi:hypothetical protein
MAAQASAPKGASETKPDKQRETTSRQKIMNAQTVEPRKEPIQSVERPESDSEVRQDSERIPPVVPRPQREPARDTAEHTKSTAGCEWETAQSEKSQTSLESNNSISTARRSDDTIPYFDHQEAFPSFDEQTQFFETQMVWQN